MAIAEARAIAALVLVARGGTDEVTLVRIARQRGIPTLIVALSPRNPTGLVVDGSPVLGVSHTSLISALETLVGGRFHDDEPPRSA